MFSCHPDPHEYRFEQTGMYDIHNRRVGSSKVGRIPFSGANAAHVSRLANEQTISSEFNDNKAGAGILENYVSVRQDIFLEHVDTRSMTNLDRVRKACPWAVLEKDGFVVLPRIEQRRKQACAQYFMLLRVKCDALRTASPSHRCCLCQSINPIMLQYKN